MIRRTRYRPDKQEKGTVEFDHVSFAYPEAGENVINDITFKARKRRDRCHHRKYRKRKEYPDQSDSKIL